MRGRGANLMQILHVAEAMQPLPAALRDDASLNEVIARLGDVPTDGLPVVDAEGRYRGTVGSQQVEQAMRENALDATAGSLAQDLPALTTRQTLEEALGALVRARSGLPVVDPDAGEPVGWLTHLDILRAYNARLQQGIAQAQPTVGSHDQREPLRRSGALARLRGYRVVDLELSAPAAPVGRRIADLPWPARSTVLAIRRGEQAFAPTDDERLEPGDRLTILVPSADAEGLVDRITADAGEPADAGSGETDQAEEPAG